MTDDRDDLRFYVLLAAETPDEMAKAATHLLEEAWLTLTDRGAQPPHDKQELSVRLLAGRLGFLVALGEAEQQDYIWRVVGELDVNALRLLACQARHELGRVGWRPETPGVAEQDAG